MLAQLVCVDRRYQRMNCFNIREIQSLLKRRFFTDLINSHDHKNLIHKTVMDLKFKINENHAHPNFFIFYNYGSELTSKNRINTFIFENSSEIKQLNDNPMISHLIMLSQNSAAFSTFNTFYI